jgi:hypothetical protein
MCKGTTHCGWGEDLEMYWHNVLCCITDATVHGLWVNHIAWTHNNSWHAHTVGTWEGYGKNELAWEIDVNMSCEDLRGAVCTVAIYQNAELHYHGRSAKPVVVYEFVDNKDRQKILDRRLDLVMKEE